MTKSKQSKKVSTSLTGYAKLLLEKALTNTPTAAPATTVKAKLSAKDPKVQAVEDALAKSPWGSSDSRTQYLAEVASAILGKPVKVASCSSSCSGPSRRGMTLVVQTNLPGYKKGTVTMFKTSGGTHGICLDSKGRMYREDNPLPLNEVGNPKVLRYATPAEIKAFVTKMAKNKDNVAEMPGYFGSL